MRHHTAGQEQSKVRLGGRMDLVSYIVDGGIVMAPIAIASVVALAVFIERMIALRVSRIVPLELVERVLAALASRRFEEADTLLGERQDLAVARMLRAAVGARDGGRALIKERLEEEGHREAAELEKWVAVIGTVAAVAPLLGLLGTVGGMITTFESIESAGGLQSVSDLAGGIRQALVTTFAGLSVGIPALIGHRYVLSRVDGILRHLEDAAIQTLEVLTADEGSS